MLVPEISLTPQMTNRFLARFGSVVAILHSKLSIGERYDEWEKIQKGEAKIIIGARSAIFAPVNNIGIVIIDEEHDMSYKSETQPRYNAKEIAKYLCKKANIPLILGSATPDLNSYYEAQEMKTTTILKLSKRANHANLPEIEVVDLRKELSMGNRTMISLPLQKEIEENLKNKRQTILFLNRRGYSTFIMCRDCGYTVKCKNCNITMTYHLEENRLKCHYCGYETKNILLCPECGSNRVKYFGMGTQKLEQEIHRMFPNATTIRMDIDTVSKKNSHEQILTKFKNENIDILIGTQMIVKGHHFPNVTLVGVIAADSNLNMDDYRASERTFQVLTQVAGRAGREKIPGKVIIQTYNPDHYSIICAKEQNYEKFYQEEIGIRKQLKYPPFCDIILIGISGNNEEKVKNIAECIFLYLQKKKLIPWAIYRPVPAPINKIKNKYRWRIIMKGKLDHTSIEILNTMIEEFYKKNQKDIQIVLDANPNNMM